MKPRSLSILCIILLAACRVRGADDASSQPPAADSAAVSPAVPGSEPYAAEESSLATLVDVRAARQGESERVVFEFRGPLPKHDVRFIEHPVQCGSGDPMPAIGGTALVARFSGAVAHRFEGERPIVTVPDRDLRPDLPLVKQLKQICDFEGEVEWMVGLEGQHRFEVSTLLRPPRIVIDIHPTR